MFLHYFLNIVFGIRVTDILALFLSWKPACGHATVHIFFSDIADCITTRHKATM